MVVTWDDSHVDNGWKPIAEAKTNAMRAADSMCKTAGFLIEIAPSYLLMTLSYWATGTDEHVTDTIQIPRHAVTNVKRLTTGRTVNLWHE